MVSCNLSGPTQLENGKPSKEPIFLRFRSSRAFIVFVVVYSIFTDIFLYGLIVPVAPTALSSKVNLPVSHQQQWTSILLALYGAALLATSPIVGHIADRVESRRGPFLFGLIALAGATSLLCVGTKLSFWIVGRLLQGASAAVVWTIGLALIVDTVGTDGLGQAMGYAGMAMMLGTMLGPLLGGIIYQTGGYYAVFGLAYGLIGIDITLRLSLIEKKHAIKWLGPKTPPISLVETPEQGAVRGSSSNASDNSSRNEDKAKPSSVRKSHIGSIFILLSSKRLLLIFWTYFVVALILTGFDSVLPLFARDTFNWQQTAQGLIFIPLTVPHVFDPLVGYIIDNYDHARRYLAAGALFACNPILVLLRLVTENTIEHKVLLCALLTLVGVCLTILLPPIVVEVSFAVQEKEKDNVFGKGGAMALSYGIMNASFAAGSIVGPFFAGFIRRSAGWGTMLWAMSLFVGLTAVPVLLLLGGPIWQRRDKKPGIILSSSSSLTYWGDNYPENVLGGCKATS